MSSYQRLDSDEENLPHGFERTGYDADTQSYTYRDRNTGGIWQGPRGARYGELRQIGQSGISNAEHDRNQQIFIDNDKRETWRMFAPWLLLVVLFLLLVGWIISPRSARMIECTDGNERYTISKGDTCWDIAERSNIKVEELADINPGLNCDILKLGQEICVPPSKQT